LIERAMNMLKINPEKCTAIVQGFGNVGSVAALSLAYKSGVKVIGISDAYAAIYNPKGIDVKAAEQHMLKKGNLRAFAQSDRGDPGHSLQRWRRDRFLFRMGAGFAGVSVERNGSDGQTLPHPRAFVCAGDQASQRTQNFASHSGHGHRRRTRYQSQTSPRLVPMSGDKGSFDLRIPLLPLARG